MIAHASRTVFGFATYLLLAVGSLSAGCAGPQRANRSDDRFWSLETAGAPAGRVEEIARALERCRKGLGNIFPHAPEPLSVLAYGDRDAFVAGLQEHFGFSQEVAAYFRDGGAPRPLRGRMLVPPGQRPVNVCHEFVHHHLESHTRRDHLLEAKWFDEGLATLLAARIFEPDRLADADRRLAGLAEGVLLPLDAISSEQDWHLLHRVPRLRAIAYLQAESMTRRLLYEIGDRGLAGVLERGREVSIQQAIAEAIGRPVEDFYHGWKKHLPEAPVRRFDLEEPRDGFLPRADPEEVGLDTEAVRTLVRQALRTRSDALLLIKDGRVVVERNPSGAVRRYETMSVTKSIVSLAIGLLIAEGKIDSVDVPLSTWFDDWTDGRKGKVTLRHVLTHTSGLAHHQGAGTLNQQADRTAYARGRPVIEEPGKRFSYNNEATQLLAGVVRQAAGTDLARYLERRLFGPLGIDDFAWERDRAGNVQAFYGLALRPRDLARIGLFMLAEGRHDGRQLLPAAWVREATRPGLAAFPMMGYLWWLRHRGHRWLQTAARLDRLAAEGLTVADRLRPLCGKEFDRAEAYWLAAGALLDDDGRGRLLAWIEDHDLPVARAPAAPLGYNANGWQGQYLAVYPRWNLVAVRLRRPLDYTEEENHRFGMRDFFDLVEATVKE